MGSGAATAAESGFTLAALIIALAAILVLMTMVVPGAEHGLRRANETEAIESLRTLNQMEGQYALAYPQRGFTCSLAALGGDARKAAPSADAAELVTPDLARGSKAGYHFVVTRCALAMRDGRNIVTGYDLAAIPDVPGKTGLRGYCTGDDAHLAADPTGGDHCTQPLTGSSEGDLKQ